MLELLLPQRCLLCARPGAHVCDECTGGLPRIASPLCERCGTPTTWPVLRCSECSGRRLGFARARAAVEYGAGARRVVVAWKERGLRKLAGWAAAVVETIVARPDAATLVWVPADPDRRLWRGHHAAELLARELADAWELPVAGVLGRARGSPRQRGSSRADRRRNVANAFRPTVAVPSRVTLVDDVYTTGATAAAAASALRKGGAEHVEVVTFARTIRIR